MKIKIISTIIYLWLITFIIAGGFTLSGDATRWVAIYAGVSVALLVAGLLFAPIAVIWSDSPQSSGRGRRPIGPKPPVADPFAKQDSQEPNP